MAGGEVSTQRLVPANEAQAAPPAARGRFRGSRVVEARRPGRRGVGQILDTAMDVLVERFGACVGIATILWLPFRVGTELVVRSEVPEVALFWGATNAAPQVLTTAFVCTLVGGQLVGHRVSLGEAIATGIGRFPGMLVISVLTVVAAVVLFCPCIVTTYAAYWLFAVVPVVYVLERGRLLPGGSDPTFARLFGWLAESLAAIGRGIRLVWGWGSFGRWAGWFLVANFAIVAPLTMAPSLLEVPMVRQQLAEIVDLDAPIGFAVVAIGALFLGIGTAYTAVVKTVYYVDERVRKEGLDLELTLARLRRRAETEAT